MLGRFLILGLIVSGIPSVEAATFDALEHDVQAALARAQVPVLVFDLDETLLDSIPRKAASFSAAAYDLCELPQSFRSHSRLEGFNKDPGCDEYPQWSAQNFYDLKNRYDVNEFFLGSDATSGWKQKVADDAMTAYLSDEFMHLDQEIPGAVSFVKKMRAVGAKIYFVSSRSLEHQSSGTYQSLRRLGFYVSDIPFENLMLLNEEVILKPDGVSSLRFKKWAFEKIQKAVEQSRTTSRPWVVSGVFENEPENMNAMIAQFPNAKAYFVRGAFMKYEPVSPKATQIDDYL